MSLSRPTTKNPAKKFISFKGSEGKFYYYDKDKQENVEVPTPFDVIILDELATIKGWHDKSQSGIFSNEVRNTTKDKLDVRSFGGNDIARGLYQDIKGDLEGGRYAKSVYCYLDGELVNLSLMGASLTAWIEKGNNAKGVTCETNPEKQKKGATEYYMPKFTDKLVSKEDLEKAIEMDKALQEFLDSKLTTNITTEEEIIEKIEEDDEDDDSLPF